MFDENYNSEEDSDYVPSDDEKKPKKSQPHSKRPSFVDKLTKKRKRVGGPQVISDDEDESIVKQVIADHEAAKVVVEPKQSLEIDDLWSSMKDDDEAPPAVEEGLSLTRPKAAAPIVQRQIAKKPKTQSAQLPTKKPRSIDDLFAELEEEDASTEAQGAEKEPVKELSVIEQALLAMKDKPKDSTSVQPTQDSELRENEVEVKAEVEYAGQKLVVKKIVEKGSKEEKRLRAMNTKKQSGLEQVVASLGKKNRINTLEKSRHDWQLSKDEEGDEDDLKQFTKDGFVAKQQFLSDVDMRQYERERQMRNAERAQKK